jgi:hypothetical protein
MTQALQETLGVGSPASVRSRQLALKELEREVSAQEDVSWKRSFCFWIMACNYHQTFDHLNRRYVATEWQLFIWKRLFKRLIINNGLSPSKDSAWTVCLVSNFMFAFPVLVWRKCVRCWSTRKLRELSRVALICCLTMPCSLNPGQKECRRPWKCVSY